MDERTALLALCAEPAAVVERSGALVAVNEHLMRALGPDGTPPTLDLLLDRLAAGVARPAELRNAAVEAAMAGRLFRKYASPAEPEGDDLEVLVLPQRTGPPGDVLVVLRLPNRRVHEQALERRHERLALLGQMAAETAHELNNVLTTIIGWSQLIAQPRPGSSLEDLAEQAHRIQAGALKAQRIVADLMGIARGQDDRPAANVAVVARDAARMMAAECARRSIELAVDVPDGLEARIRRTRLSQVLLNLLRNAFQALRRDGRVQLAARAEDGFVVLQVVDDGPGMDAATRARAFDPFFTTRRGGEGGETGTGLGLSLCRKIVEQEASGTIRLDSAPERGTTVEIRLPVSAVQDVRRHDTGVLRRVPPAPCDFSLLVVERDAEVAELVSEVLRHFWHLTPIAVSSVDSAVQALRARGFSACLIDADIDPDGPLALADRLRAVRPGLPVVLAAAGDSWATLDAVAADDGGPGVLQKPFTVGQLLEALAAASLAK
ncbi:MAG: hypothetical protein JXB32_07565 [Deltaproteobacteria bacterium]|nr:hypothetical protein [Deltaproteobacteria bacterium]